MPMIMSNFDNITKSISLNIKVATTAAFKLWDKEWKGVITKETTDLFKEQAMGYEGGGVIPVKAEGGQSSTTRIYQGHIQTIFQSTYSFDMPVSWEQRRFAHKSYKFTAQMGSYQSRSANLRYEYSGVSVLDNGWTAGAYAGGDTVAYFSNAHTWKSTGATYSNLLTASDLNKTSLEAALQQIAAARQESNIPAMLKADKVIIGYENIFVLPELLKSSLDPETANNTYNVFQDFKLNKVLNHFVSDTDSWVIDTQIETRKLLEAQGPKMDEYIDGPTKNLVENIMVSVGTGFENPMGAHGNQGS